MTPLDELLALWRETRAPEVADLLAHAAPPRPPITGGSQRALHAAWLAIAAARDPHDVDRLLATLVTGNLTQAKERLAHLATRPPDPRIAAALEGVLANPPSAAFVKGSSIDFWNALFDLLARIADPRTATIHERLPWLAYERAPSPFDVGTLRSRTINRVAKLAQAIPPATPLTAAQRARLSELAPRPTLDPSAALLDRIYQHPRDLEARSVYADWLTAQGDPRGELIALQLARPSPTARPWQWYRDRGASTRERTLLRTHEKLWIGRLGTLLQHVHFERGFPAWGHLSTEVELAALAALPEAATLEHLAVRRDYLDAGRMLAQPPFHGLTSISAIGWKTLAGLLEHADTPIRTVEIAYGELPTELDFLARTDAPLDLLDLEIGHMASPSPNTAHVHAFLRAPVIRRLHTLCVGGNVGNDEAFVEGFASASSTIRRLELHDPSDCSTIDRLDAGFHLVIAGDNPRGHAALGVLRRVAGDAEIEVVMA